MEVCLQKYQPDQSFEIEMNCAGFYIGQLSLIIDYFDTADSSFLEEYADLEGEEAERIFAEWHQQVYQRFYGAKAYPSDQIILYGTDSSEEIDAVIARIDAVNGQSAAEAGGVSSWVPDENGWWYDNGDGTWPANTRKWIDGNQDGVICKQ